MTEAEIKAFLAICRSGNMTKAAENLYISQPSLSSRIKTLEREVGQALFYRHKGGRETVLTPKGEEFYRLAVEYESIVERMQRLCVSEPMKLRVSSIHSVGTYILPPVYEAFMQRYPEIELVIQDLEFEMARKSVVQGFTDIAFNTSGGTGKGFKVRPAFSEPMTLICAADSAFPDLVTMEMLDIKKEIYVDWGEEFKEWHTSFFGHNASPPLRLEIMEQLKYFAARKEHWALVPISAALSLRKDAGIKQCSTDFDVPRRTINCVTQGENSENIICVRRFLQCMEETLSELKKEGLELLL